jgi:hypothetical protein
MLGDLLKMIFLPKRARAKLEAQARDGGSGPRRRASGQPQVAAGRDRVLDEAMSVYRRQQRDVYDNLDEETRRQIEEDAAKAFGDVLKDKN